MTKIVHIGDGRHIELDEGAAFRPPIEKPKNNKRGRFKEWESKSTKARKKDYQRRPEHDGENNPLVKPRATQPGFHEWTYYKALILSRYRDAGHKAGDFYGVRRSKQGYYRGWVKRRVKVDMENIKKVMPDLDDVASEALEGALSVLRGPTSQQMKLAASKLLLEFSKAKPVAKSEVTVNAAEAWLASLADTDDAS